MRFAYTGRVEQAITITFEDSGREPVESSIQIAELGLSGRVKRGLFALGLFWAVAFIGVFIPLIGHFVMLPGGLIAGPIAFLVRLRKKVVLAAKEMPCPKCGKPLPIEEGTAGWPAKLMCNECSARLKLTPRT